MARLALVLCLLSVFASASPRVLRSEQSALGADSSVEALSEALSAEAAAASSWAASLMRASAMDESPDVKALSAGGGAHDARFAQSQEQRASAVAEARIDPVSAVSTALIVTSYIMDAASATIDAKTALDKSAVDAFIGRVAAEMGRGTDKLSEMYTGIVGDIAMRVTESTRDVTLAVFQTLSDAQVAEVQALAITNINARKACEATCAAATASAPCACRKVSPPVERRFPVIADFLAAGKESTAAPTDAAKRLEAKRALFRLARMDVERSVGIGAEEGYVPYVLGSFDPNLARIGRPLRPPPPAALSMGSATEEARALMTPETRMAQCAQLLAAGQELYASASETVDKASEAAESEKAKELAKASSESGLPKDAGRTLSTAVAPVIKAAAPVNKAETKVEASAKSAGASMLATAGVHASSVAHFMPLVGPAIMFAKSGARLAVAIKASYGNAFKTARNTGTALERTRLNFKRSLHGTCTMMRLAQAQIGSVLLSFSSGSKTTTATFADLAAKLTSMLGLPAPIVAAIAEAKQAQTAGGPALLAAKLGKTYARMICALLRPIHARINTLFREYGKCAELAQEPYGAVDRSTSTSWEMADATRATASAKHAHMAHIDTCHNDDIYDAILVRGVHAPAWTAQLGYAPVQGQAGIQSQFALGELNSRPECTKSIKDDAKIACTYPPSGGAASATSAHSRMLLVLTCASLKAKLGELASATDADKVAQLAYLKSLTMPLSDLRIVSRPRGEGGLPVPTPGSEEAAAIATGLRPLRLTGASGGTDTDAQAALSWRATTPVFPAIVAATAKLFLAPLTKVKAASSPPVFDNELTADEAVLADLRAGNSGATPAFFAYMARGGASVITGITLAPLFYKGPEDEAWKKYSRSGTLFNPLETWGWQNAQTNTIRNLASAGDFAAAADVTILALNARQPRLMPALAAPLGCSVATKRSFAWYMCDVSSDDKSGKPSKTRACSSDVARLTEEDIADLPRTTRISRAIWPADASKPDPSMGLVTQDFHTTCASISKGVPNSSPDYTSLWERVLPTPSDPVDSETNSMLVASYYIWTRVRFVTPPVRAEDPITCHADNDPTLLPDVVATAEMHA